MNELLINIETFKQQLTYSISNSKLPAEIMKMIMSEYLQVLVQASNQQLVQAKESMKKEEKKDESTN